MVITRPVSQTALLVAAYRARLTAAGSDLCHDPWAGPLSGGEGARLARRMDQVRPTMELWIGVRTRWFDDQVRRFTDADVHQLVVLGAGLDSRAERFARPGLGAWEVDAPTTQAEKLRRARELDGYPLEAATHVPCDFTHQDVADRLLESGLRADEPAVVVWEGVTYYLDDASVRATLSSLAARLHPRSVVLFDRVERRFVSGDVPDEDRATSALVEDLGEPMTWGVNDVLPLLVDCGYRHVSSTSFDEATLAFTGTYHRDRAFRFQHLVAASPGRQLW